MDGGRSGERDSPHPGRIGDPGHAAVKHGDRTRSHMDRVLLHDELAAILRGRENWWTTTTDLAAEVNRRGRYKKRDGSTVSAPHLHGVLSRGVRALARRDRQPAKGNRPWPTAQTPATRVAQEEGLADG